jgi:hypothetical protein
LEEQLRKLALPQSNREGLPHEESKERDGKARDLNNRMKAQLESYQQELEGYIAADCPLCGYAMILALSRPLISAEEANESVLWEL